LNVEHGTLNRFLLTPHGCSTPHAIFLPSRLALSSPVSSIQHPACYCLSRLSFRPSSLVGSFAVHYIRYTIYYSLLSARLTGFSPVSAYIGPGQFSKFSLLVCLNRLSCSHIGHDIDINAGCLEHAERIWSEMTTDNHLRAGIYYVLRALNPRALCGTHIHRVINYSMVFILLVIDNKFPASAETLIHHSLQGSINTCNCNLHRSSLLCE